MTVLPSRGFAYIFTQSTGWKPLPSTGSAG